MVRETGYCRSGRRREGPSHSGAKRAGRKRLQVDHITLDMLQEHGLFDMPIQVEPSPTNFRPVTWETAFPAV